MSGTVDDLKKKEKINLLFTEKSMPKACSSCAKDSRQVVGASIEEL